MISYKGLLYQTRYCMKWQKSWCNGPVELNYGTGKENDEH